MTGRTKFPVSADLHTEFFKPIPIGPGRLAESRIERIGKGIVFTSAIGLNAGSGVCAKAVHAAMLMDAARA